MCGVKIRQHHIKQILNVLGSIDGERDVKAPGGAPSYQTSSSSGDWTEKLGFKLQIIRNINLGGRRGNLHLCVVCIQGKTIREVSRFIDHQTLNTY